MQQLYLKLKPKLLEEGQIEGVSGKRGQVPFENLDDHVVGIKQNFGTWLNSGNIC